MKAFTGEAESLHSLVNWAPPPTINVELIVHVLWDPQKEGSVANLESLKPSGRHREREHLTERGSTVIICAGYRKGRRAPSC